MRSIRFSIAVLVLLVLHLDLAHAQDPSPPPLPRPPAPSPQPLAPFAARLESLAAKCDELGLKEQAEKTHGWIIPRHAGRQYLFLPTMNDSSIKATGKAAAPGLVGLWKDKFLALRREQAQALFGVASEAIQQRDAGRAYRLLFEVLREDADHAEARRILGYKEDSRGDWEVPGAGNLAAQQARTDHPKLGWRSRMWWRLETPHFSIESNHSPREALELGRHLEDLHALWRQLFFEYWSTPEALAARFAGRNEPLSPNRPKMKAVLFKDRREYLAQLQSGEPQIALTVGIYMDKQRTAYFYGGDTTVYPTWYHEATHQLFHESLPGTAQSPAEARNFWAIEGAALYMESLTQHEGYWTSGGCEANRLQFARYRALSGDFSLPIERLSALGRQQVQKSDDIGKIYAQAAGWSHFLIDGQSGKRRPAFIGLLTAIYGDKDTSATLSTAAGVATDELDKQYLQFLNLTDDDLAGIPAPERLKNLSLGRTSVTDRGMQALSDCEQLEWLDLSLTAISDNGLQSLTGLTNLRQLFLERTKVTNAGLPNISGYKQLEELDLSHLAITDDGLAAISSLRNLKSLYLNGSPITDAGLAHLTNLKRLEQLDISGTRITPAGLKKLEQSLPKLHRNP